MQQAASKRPFFKIQNWNERGFVLYSEMQQVYLFICSTGIQEAASFYTEMQEAFV